MRRLLLIAVVVSMTRGLSAGERPEGSFLFQPMLIWGNSEVTRQGTGYLLNHQQQLFGATSIHFLDFKAGGLFEAIWLDIPSSKPVVGFRTSLGKPEVDSIDDIEDVAHDFLLMPLDRLPAGCSAIEIENVEAYPHGYKLWFPNKTREEEVGYQWVEAEVVQDDGHVIAVEFSTKVELQSQSGTPFFSEATGKAVGMLMGGNEDLLYLCPARGIFARLESAPPPISLMKSITTD